MLDERNLELMNGFVAGEIWSLLDSKIQGPSLTVSKFQETVRFVVQNVIESILEDKDPQPSLDSKRLMHTLIYSSERENCSRILNDEFNKQLSELKPEQRMKITNRLGLLRI